MKRSRKKPRGGKTPSSLDSPAPPLPGARIALVVVAAFVVTVGVYAPLGSSTAWFLDDDQYVFDNPLVQRADWAAFRTFFTEVLSPSTVRGYYQPLTMASLTIDCRLGGHKGNLRPFKITNLLLHSANTGLLALWLSILLGRPLPALLAALLFGLHPIHVECVAWLAQRKTLLSVLFALTSLIAYTIYARRPRPRTYTLCVAAFALGCLAKPTVVPLPVLMLALDYWPLRRPVRKAIIEKLPLLVIAVAFGLITIVSQARSAAIVSPGQQHNIPTILFVSVYSLAFYASKIVVPIHLVPAYSPPAPFGLANPLVLTGVLGGIAIVVLFILGARRSRALATGGVFFLLAWLPASGVIRFTKVFAADRFVYFPLIGLALPLVALFGWLLGGPTSPRFRLRVALSSLAILIALGTLARETRAQLARWRNTDTLVAYIVSRIPPKLTTPSAAYADIWTIGGISASEQHRLHDALTCFARAATANDRSAVAACNLGSAHLRLGQPRDAANWFRKAIELDRDYALPYTGLGSALRILEHLREAETTLRRAVELAPSSSAALFELARTLEKQGQLSEAEAYHNKALSLDPDNHEIQNNYAWMLATCHDPALRDSRRALDLARRACEGTKHANADFLDTLAAAYAAAGRFDQAVTTGQTALALATEAQADDLANQIRNRLQLYRQRMPYVERPQEQNTNGP